MHINNQTNPNPSHRVQSFNIIILVVAGLALLCYIFVSNYILSQHYRFEVLKHRLDQAHMLADAHQSDGPDSSSMKVLTNFAQKSGMVEAKDVYALFQESGVAVSRLGN